MHFLGYCCKSRVLVCEWKRPGLTVIKVVYQAGVNEKLLGDFIRKHNVRDKIFSPLLMLLVWSNSSNLLQLPRSVGSMFSTVIVPSPTQPPMSRSTSKELLKGWALLLICIIYTGLILVSPISTVLIDSECWLFEDTPLEESIPALDEIRKAGKTKYIGLSECSAKTLHRANSS